MKGLSGNPSRHARTRNIATQTSYEIYRVLSDLSGFRISPQGMSKKRLRGLCLILIMWWSISLSSTV